MSGWNAMSYDAKDNLLRVVRAEAEGMFAMASAPGAWEAPTACPQWQVRDIIGHIIDVTESYFVGFDAARSGATVADAFGTRAMQGMLDEGAKGMRSLSQTEAIDRLRTDFEKLMEMVSALGPDEWGGLTVPHKYMGPLPAFFYPTFQLMDYGVHSWDIRQGTGRAHGLSRRRGRPAGAVHVHPLVGDGEHARRRAAMRDRHPRDLRAQRRHLAGQRRSGRFHLRGR